MKPQKLILYLMKKTMLVILDGWGIGKKNSTNAIFSAHTPFMDSIETSVPKATLNTFGEHVGLPDGQMGNSEVGHMNIGAGRVVWQMLVRIDKSFQEGSIQDTDAIKKLIELAKQNPNRKIHLMGLVSDGGVHSSLNHLLGLTQLLQNHQLDDRTYIHAFTDGRDTDPYSGKNFLKQVVESPKFGKSKLATITGRYYAMDRDNRWERTQLAYDALIHMKGDSFDTYSSAFQSNYDQEITDEFIKPCIIDPLGAIQSDDILLCFNFRTDRGRQISRVLTQRDMPDFNMHTLNLNYFTMTEYDKTYQNVHVVFHSKDLTNTLGEVLANHHKTQLRAAETEKYPHVTFFFNGGREEPFEGEARVTANSPKVSTYDLQPEMSAPELTKRVMNYMSENNPDFVCINYANPDMVGHTGVFNAIKKACETVDKCAHQLVSLGQELGYSIVLTADHGNADMAVNEDGTPNTAHTTNLVPIYIIDKSIQSIRSGKLGDIAPTILDIMQIQIPSEMDGSSLIN